MTIILQYLKELTAWCTTSYLILLLPCLFSSKQNNKPPYVRILLVAYIIGISSQTIFPRFELGIDGASGRLFVDVDLTLSIARRENINLIPFKTIYQMLIKKAVLVSAEDAPQVIIANLLGNICLFLPLGFLLPFSGQHLNKFVPVTLFVLAFSVFLEAVQFFTGGSVDIDDILLRVIGTWVGYAAYALISGSRRIEGRKRLHF